MRKSRRLKVKEERMELKREKKRVYMGKWDMLEKLVGNKFSERNIIRSINLVILDFLVFVKYFIYYFY